MAEFRKNIEINCSAKKAFDFHTDTNNLKKITPPRIKVNILKLELPLKKGSDIELGITQFGFIRTKWRLKIDDYEPEKMITDLQTSGPFKFWKHSHIFEETASGKTMMTDLIVYKMPLGVLGKIADVLFVRKMIASQFEFRHRVTKEILESN